MFDPLQLLVLLLTVLLISQISATGSEVPSIDTASRSLQEIRQLALTKSLPRRSLTKLLSNHGNVQVIIGYGTDEALQYVQNISTFWHQSSSLERIDAVAAAIPESLWQNVTEHEGIEWIDKDEAWKPTSTSLSEAVYGLEMIQGTSQRLVSSTILSSDSPCNDPNGLRIGILDSGLDTSHVDIPCMDIDNPETNCIGTEIDLYEDELWYKPDTFHGTHVTGIIGALGNNDFGFRGVINGSAVCFVTVRVFGRNTDALLTSILDGVEFAVSVNASIINLSLGGGPYSYAADKYFQKMVEAGVTLVAAAGNEGSGDTPSYPASYESVISVAAVDQAMERADFSNFNDMIDLSAPGAGVLSTVPMGNGSIAVFSNGEDIRIGSFLEYSVPLASNQTTTGSIVHCPNLGFDICPGPGGHFCLIKRGTTSFASKAKNCELSGGIAALIYNDGVGYLMGTLENSTINIPVIGLSEEDGLALLFNNANEHNGNSTDVVISSVDGYGFSDGTSMAAPYLTGSVALLKQSCAACSNNDIVRCLKATASDLGEDGWDTIYGHGLIQLEDAFNCLVDTLECCYESQVSEQQPTNVGSGAAPTIMPSQSNETTSSLYPVPSKTRYTAMPSLLPLPTYQIIGLLHTDVPTKLGASVAIDANEMLPPSSIGYWLPEEDTSSASASIKFLVVSISMLYVLLEFA